jgi:hypothetical protein
MNQPKTFHGSTLGETHALQHKNRITQLRDHTTKLSIGIHVVVMEERLVLALDVAVSLPWEQPLIER